MQQINSEFVNNKIQTYRKYKAEIAELKNNNAEQSVIKEHEKLASACKKGLPAFTFQATFVRSKSAKGREGIWRKQSAAKLNGLYVCDFDHIEDPRKLFFDMCNKQAKLVNEEVMLAFITVSGQGLKIVAKADASRGNIIDNARYFANLFGIETDESCKDATRLSFCPGKDDILMLNKEIFNYENEEFDKKFGESYRNNNSASVACSRNLHNDNIKNNVLHNARNVKLDNNGEKDESHVDKENVTNNNCIVKIETDENGNYCYKGVKYIDIIERLALARGGWPSVGGRHLFTLQLAADLRYICENDKTALVKILSLCRTAQEIIAERGEGEIESIADAATSHNLLSYMPKRLRVALESLHISTSQSCCLTENRENNKVDYLYWWKRLKPLLSAGFDDAVAPLKDEIKLGGVLAAGAMFGTYLTKCWWEHYDGNKRRLSYLVYVIGDAASGKSFIIDLDKDIMDCLRSKDKIGRDWEREYKEDKARRATSRKDQGKESQEIKHPVIRYVPSTISNAKFYQRSMDAVDEVQGQEMHLHLYTMESELSTALRAQVGSWAGKLDLECKSFQNEYAGVDYANEQSVNGLIQVNWNQVVSGTLDAMRRKIQPSTVLDGLVTRLALWLMPSNDYTMVERKKVEKDEARSIRLKTWGYRLDECEGCLPCERLVDAAYEWCARKAETAKFEEDHILDYFRKRIPMYMVRYGVVRALLRQFDNYKKTNRLEINDDDVAFAELIGDYLLYMQMYMFGMQVEQALETQSRDFRPRQRKSKLVDLYLQLPEEFTVNDLIKVGYLKSSANVIASKLTAKDIIEHVAKGRWRKKRSSIDDVALY